MLILYISVALKHLKGAEIMRKPILLFTLSLSLFFCGCNNKDVSNSEPERKIEEAIKEEDSDTGTYRVTEKEPLNQDNQRTDESYKYAELEKILNKIESETSTQNSVEGHEEKK